MKDWKEAKLDLKQKVSKVALEGSSLVGVTDKQKTILVLQGVVTKAASQSMTHRLESRMFAKQGFTKLAEKYAAHAAEEAESVELFADRILNLGGEVKQQAQSAVELCTDIEDFLKADLKESEEGLAQLAGVMDAGFLDVTSYELMKDYIMDEEEDMYWTQSQLDMIAAIGKQNYLSHQL
ncbi:MAG: bacterioferritin [Clostridia bacterium]|nr:bacterioferritin [Clostridia bacterium]MBQ8925940.1 bacterioferritin [Clostridia bacterium]